MVFPSAKPHACSPGLLRGQSDHKNRKSGRKPLGSLEGHRELPTKRAGPRGSGTAGPALGEMATEGQPGPRQGLVVVSQTQAAPRSCVTFLSPPLPQALGSFPGLIRVRPQPRSGRGKQDRNVTTAPRPAPHPLSPLRWLAVGWRCCFLWLRPKWAVAEDTVAAVYSTPVVCGKLSSPVLTHLARPAMKSAAWDPRLTDEGTGAQCC